LHAAPSSRHANIRSAGAVIASLPANANVASAVRSSPSGPLVMTVSGAVLSTMIERGTLADSLPAASVASTATICAPSNPPALSHIADALTVEAGGAGSTVG